MKKFLGNLLGLALALGCGYAAYYCGANILHISAVRPPYDHTVEVTYEFAVGVGCGLVMRCLNLAWPVNNPITGFMVRGLLYLMYGVIGTYGFLDSVKDPANVEVLRTHYMLSSGGASGQLVMMLILAGGAIGDLLVSALSQNVRASVRWFESLRKGYH